MTTEMILTLAKFEVYGLFDMIDYQALDFSRQNIIILYGPNGTGKTTILKLINLFKQGKFDEMAEIKFDKIIFHFEKFIKKQEVTERGVSHGEENFSIEIVNHQDSNLTISFFEDQAKKPVKTYKFSFKLPFNEFLRIRNETEGLVPNGKDIFRVPSRVLMRRFKRDDLDLYFSYLEKVNFKPKQVEKLMEFAEEFSKTQKKFSCHFIPAERLNVQNLNLSKEEMKKASSVIQHKSNILTEQIKDNFDNYVKISQAKDKDLIGRVIGSIESQVKYSYNEVLKELEEFEKYQGEYTNAGLDTSGVAMDIDFRSPLEKSKEWEDQNQTQLLYRILKNVIYRDRWAKLNVFTSLKNKIELLMTIVNEHLKGKYLQIHHEKGFVIKTKKSGEELGLNLLSSGEMNMIILFFELIFETEKNTIIMIDEPEISLHVEWQIRFVENLMKLQKSNILLATHSPQIIHDHWELTLELTVEE